LEAGGEVAAYDAGPAGRGSDTGEGALVSFLRHRGYRELSWLIVSHEDPSHSGGTGELVRNLDIGQVRVGEQAVTLGERALCSAGERIGWQEVEFEFLWPRQPGKGGDEGSCVVRVHAAGASILLTGDIGAATERRLVREHGAALATDVVIVPNHGSNRSSTVAFVQASAPRHALISAGYRNRYGFPRPEVVQRYQAVGADVRITAAEGAIELRVLRDGTLLIDGQRRRHGRYYHRRVEL
ncbi:MAG TPA: MBL fold metallo-hydrolase, partial [Gammaproteobacteria bacterium]|nr:MBL fold metallo-hydrolase [Gammaproteobacteria bacterium]